MVEHSSSTLALLQRIREGDQEAGRRFVEKYQPHVLRIVRKLMPEAIRKNLDSVDLVQDVWCQFFDKVIHERRFETDDELMAYLLKMIANQVLMASRRYLLTQKNDPKREVSLSGPQMRAEAGPPDRGPSAEETAIALETWDSMVDGQIIAYQRILLLRREGLSYKEIAERLHTSEKTIQRLIRAALRKLERDRPE